MTNNPFLSETFASIWLKHFNMKGSSYKFDFIKNVSFIKSRFLPLYINVGKNITNGMSYKFNGLKDHLDYKNKVFLIYDVPTYFDLNAPEQDSKFKIKHINQYKGVLADISDYQSLDDLLQHNFKSKNRYNLKKKLKHLETCFNLSYSTYYGDISDKEYQHIAERLKALIAKRFNSLKKHNMVISSWDYYLDLMRPMIINKKAVLVTVNIDNNPVGMSFNFLSDNVLFYAITTFDTDYLNFNIGHTTIMQIFKWCFENNISILDFSKGETEYKNRWMNRKYYFQCHILYDSGSVFPTIIAHILSGYFKFKQHLRDKNVNTLFAKLKFLLKRSKKDITSQSNYTIIPLPKNEPLKYSETPINLNDAKYATLRPVILKNLSKNPEPVSNLKIYADNKFDHTFIVKCNKQSYKIVFL